MPDYVWDIYHTTPIMSTYLVAMLVSEYSISISDSSQSDIQVRILAREGIIGQTKYGQIYFKS